MRASIYNAMPTEGVEKLCDFIKAFDKNNSREVMSSCFVSKH